MKIDPSVHKYLNENFEQIRAGTHSLYVGIKGGGCSGLQYVFELVALDVNKHIAIDMWVISDKKSAMFLNNCVLVYKESVGAKILVVENADAKSECGCGQSFTL